MAKKKVKKTTKKAVKKIAKKPTKKITKKIIKNAIKKAAPKKAVTKKSALKKSPLIKSKLQKSVTKKVTAQASKSVDYSKAITPLGSRLVIRVAQAERITAGGLIIPVTAETTAGYLKGEVLAAGQGTFSKKGHHLKLDVKVGDIVFFSEYSSTQIKFNNENLHIVNENDILGVAK